MQHSHPDVVIVGGGLAGLATAWHLAPHARVKVLEQADQVGAEASSQNAGMVRRLGEDPYERALAVRSAAWMADPGEAWLGGEVSRVVGAVLGLAIDEHHLTDAVAHLRARGVRVESLESAAQVAEVAPALEGAPLRQAWWVPDERVGDPWAMMQGFVAGIRAYRGEIRTGTRVRELLVERGRVVGVVHDGGEARAEHVVLATGAWSARLVAPLGIHRPLIPLRRTLVQSAPHARSSPRHPWVWVDDVGIYARPEAGGWLVSGCDEAVDWPAAGPGSRGPVEPEHRALAQAKLERWIPALHDADLRAGWTGLRTFAPDRRPVLGADPAAPGLWWATALGGFGVTCSAAAGEAVAAWVRGEETPWLQPRSVSPGRDFLRRWPIRPDGDLRTSAMVDTIDTIEAVDTAEQVREVGRR